MLRRLICLALLALGARAQGDSPLCRAAARGDLPEVRALLDAGAGLSGAPLLCAVSLQSRYGNAAPNPDYPGVLQLLFARGADPNARDPYGRTALIVAMMGSASEYKVVGSNEAVARLLLAHGADPNAADTQGWTPLLMLLDQWLEQPVLVRLLLDRGAGLNARKKDGVTGLMLAARRGAGGMVELLLSRGARIDDQDEHGTTALMLAAAGRRDEFLPTVKFLLAHGAAVNLRDRQGHSALDHAILAGYPERVDLLLPKSATAKDRQTALQAARDRALMRLMYERASPAAVLATGGDPNAAYENGETPLMAAARQQDSAVPMVQALLARGARPNASDRDGNTALMFAADRYNPESVRLLLAAGADPNARDHEGNTVLIHAASAKGSWLAQGKPLVQLLLDRGADPRPANAKGFTALMGLAQEGNSELPALLDAHVDVNARDGEGNTALLYAARFCFRDEARDAVEALLHAGAGATAANRDGETALFVAARQYRPECTELLLSAGAGIDAATREGRTPLMAAIDGPEQFDNEHHVVYSPAIARLLMDRGANVNARDAEGRTPLMLAERRGHQDIIPLLIEHHAAGAH